MLVAMSGMQVSAAELPAEELPADELEAGFDREKIKSIRVVNGKVYLPEDSRGYDDNKQYQMFGRMRNLTSLDLSGFDTSKVTNMEGMFFQCNNLASLDLSNFDTSKVESINNAFKECRSLTSLDLSSFDMSSVVRTDGLLDECSALQELRTPKKSERSIELPITMCDDTGNTYEKIPALSKSIVLTINKLDIANCAVTLSASNFIYDGKAKEPAVTVKNGNTTLTLGRHYLVSYADNTNAGTATVRVKGIGGFQGEKTVTFHD